MKARPHMEYTSGDTLATLLAKELWSQKEFWSVAKTITISTVSSKNGTLIAKLSMKILFAFGPKFCRTASSIVQNSGFSMLRFCQQEFFSSQYDCPKLAAVLVS
jgi:hypothetical protein